MSDFPGSEGLLPLRCTADRPRPDVRVVHLAGELDIATTPVAARYLREQTADRPEHLVVDLSGVTLLAAAAVALIVDVLRDTGDRLHVVGVTGNRPVERVLVLSRVGALLDVHDDVQVLLDRLDPR